MPQLQAAPKKAGFSIFFFFFVGVIWLREPSLMGSIVFAEVF